MVEASAVAELTVNEATINGVFPSPVTALTSCPWAVMASDELTTVMLAVVVAESPLVSVIVMVAVNVPDESYVCPPVTAKAAVGTGIGVGDGPMMTALPLALVPEFETAPVVLSGTAAGTMVP